MWHPTEDDLQIWTRNALEDAYQQRERPRCSRDDFRDGFISALIYLRSRSSFMEGLQDEGPAARQHGLGEGED